MKALEIMKFGSNLLREKRISSSILDSEILLSKTLNKKLLEVISNYLPVNSTLLLLARPTEVELSPLGFVSP